MIEKTLYYMQWMPFIGWIIAPIQFARKKKSIWDKYYIPSLIYHTITPLIAIVLI